MCLSRCFNVNWHPTHAWSRQMLEEMRVEIPTQSTLMQQFEGSNQRQSHLVSWRWFSKKRAKMAYAERVVILTVLLLCTAFGALGSERRRKPTPPPPPHPTFDGQSKPCDGDPGRMDAYMIPPPCPAGVITTLPLALPTCPAGVITTVFRLPCPRLLCADPPAVAMCRPACCCCVPIRLLLLCPDPPVGAVS